MEIRGLKKQARNTLRHNYWRAVGVILLLGFFTSGLRLDLSTRLPSFEQSVSIIEGRADIGKTNSDIVNELLDFAREKSTFLQDLGEKYHPTAGVLSGIFNSITASGSLLFGLLNAFNQMLLGDRLGAGIVILIGTLLMFLLWFFVSNVLKVGQCRFFIQSRSYYKTGIGSMLLPYKTGRTRSVAVTMFLRWLFTALWSFTIVGGVIKYYSYRMIPYILAENPDIGHKEAFARSKQLMKGQKMRAFLLDLSFIGWRALNLLTFNILNRLYVEPYIQASFAELYIELRQKAEIFDSYLGVRPSDTAYPEELYPLYKKERKIRLKLNYDRKYSITSLILLFFTFSGIGWVWEVLLHLITNGEFVNRGTLYGPWLPIYGVGGVLVLVLLKRFANRPWLTWLLSVLVCGVIEYGTALVLWETRHLKYWDYSGYLLNIQGRVCLEGLLLFGVGGCAFIYILAPFFDELYKKIPKRFTVTACTVLLVTFSFDNIYCNLHPRTGNGITEAKYLDGDSCFIMNYEKE